MMISSSRPCRYDSSLLFSFKSLEFTEFTLKGKSEGAWLSDLRDPDDELLEINTDSMSHVASLLCVTIRGKVPL